MCKTQIPMHTLFNQINTFVFITFLFQTAKPKTFLNIIDKHKISPKETELNAIN